MMEQVSDGFNKQLTLFLQSQPMLVQLLTDQLYQLYLFFHNIKKILGPAVNGVYDSLSRYLFGFNRCSFKKGSY